MSQVSNLSAIIYSTLIVDDMLSKQVAIYLFFTGLELIYDDHFSG